jgi:hypothetical protein
VSNVSEDLHEPLERKRIAPEDLFAQAFIVLPPEAFAREVAPTDAAVTTTPRMNAPKRLNFISKLL